MSGPRVSRGEVWFADLDPTRGREQAGHRPVLIVSDDFVNHGPSDLAIVLPVTSRDRGIPSHVRIDPPEGGLQVPSFAMTEAIRSISRQRLTRRLGAVADSTMETAEDRLRILLRL